MSGAPARPTDPGAAYLASRRILEPGRSVQWIARDDMDGARRALCFPSRSYRDGGGDRRQRIDAGFPDTIAGVLNYRWWSRDGKREFFELEGIMPDGTRAEWISPDPDGKPAKRISQPGRGIHRAAFVVRQPDPLRGGRLHVCEGAPDALSLDAMGAARPEDGIIGMHGCWGMRDAAPWCAGSADVLIYPHRLDKGDIGEKCADKLADALAGRGHVVRSNHAKRHDLNDELCGEAPRRTDAYSDTGRLSLDALAPLLKDCAAVSEPVDWLWRGYVARGLMFAITGAPDAGKTIGSLGVCSALSAGAALPGDEAREPKRVAWVGGVDEDPHGLIVARLREAGASGDNLRVFKMPEVDQLRIAEVCEALREWQPDLVVVDSHVSWFRESNDGAAVRAELQGVFGGLLRDGAACGIVSHWRKSGVEDGPQHFRTAGSNMGLIGAVRLALEFEKASGADAGTMRVTKHNIGPQPDDVEYRIAGRGMGGMIGVVEWGDKSPHVPREPGGGGGRAVSDDDALGAVRTIAAAGKPVTASKVNAELGIGNSPAARVAAARALDRLTAAGALTAAPGTVRGNKCTIYAEPEQPAAAGAGTCVGTCVDRPTDVPAGDVCRYVGPCTSDLQPTDAPAQAEPDPSGEPDRHTSETENDHPSADGGGDNPEGGSATSRSSAPAMRRFGGCLRPRRTAASRIYRRPRPSSITTRPLSSSPAASMACTRPGSRNAGRQRADVPDRRRVDRRPGGMRGGSREAASGRPCSWRR